MRRFTGRQAPRDGAFMHIVSGPNRKWRQQFKVVGRQGGTGESIHLLTSAVMWEGLLAANLAFQLAGLTLISSLQRGSSGGCTSKSNVCVRDEMKSRMRRDAQPSEQMTAREREQSQLIFGHVRHGYSFCHSCFVCFFPFFFWTK